MDIIEVGKIVNTRGLKGEVKVIPYLDDLTAFDNFKFVIADGVKYPIKSVKYNKGKVFLTLFEIDTIEKADSLRNKIISVYESSLPKLNEGEYYIKDLIGLTVYDNEGQKLGNIISVEKTGKNDIYIIKGENEKEIIIPAIKEVVLKIDLKSKSVTVKLLDGLI